jgi:UDP-glucose 4-epimerase
MVLRQIALTGATGMLGRHVLAEMASEHIDVLTISRPGGEGSRLWDLAEWLSDAELDRVFAGAQAIVHAAAMVRTTEPVDRAQMFNVNVRSCLNLGEWALRRGLPIIHVSSSTVYADPRQECLPEEAVLGWSGVGGFYALTKLLAEDVLARLAQRGLRLAVVRPSSLYGHGLPGGMIRRFLTAARAQEVITLTEPVDDRIDFIHASDLGRAIIAILRKEAWDTYNIASGQLTSLLELAEACILATNSKSTIARLRQGNARPPTTQFGLNIDRAKSRLDWKPRCDLHQGLRRMAEGRILAG